MSDYLNERFQFEGLQEIIGTTDKPDSRRYVLDLNKSIKNSRLVKEVYSLIEMEGTFDGYVVKEAILQFSPYGDWSYDNGVNLTLKKELMAYKTWWFGIMPAIDIPNVNCSLGIIWTDIVKSKNDMPQRIPISKRLRVQVLDRDNSTCQLCGATIEDGVKLHVDHIMPVSKGGTNDLDNLQTLCAQCNLGKGDFTELNMVKDKLRGE
ncbi:HNH endonuclease [uncultured Methanobrevibacter sp.]|uniref:HNH endonuclease n=1 Tax=uncultured Methanobrevibacter sp. TaxID=253161 RepID=UPI0025DFC0C8|nr:HNH endonuclease [uncultured Methanobrevibacter sp.]